MKTHPKPNKNECKSITVLKIVNTSTTNAYHSYLSAEETKDGVWLVVIV